ncbi:sugar ABC transporter substrate-binding protein [Paeniglutamicibacter terrestris]|uniref:Maltose ABC transporter substrate-binding protein n=1 Tax=Paeniglutamicibacter terrestris TaxID=2723403 RepID=A0ABX1G6C8_9MICC|nr:maltose ABC transporter substrate-binding protein [Paeniglutamicibacter terrestris]ASN40511.1 maltose ABC transporter substrate-binding protein [Arthrobacter sp. 7749]NKG21549.1 maltose ABC transporter substrate-binding protein [Paeniglutamicibacter terrestris]
MTGNNTPGARLTRRTFTLGAVGALSALALTACGGSGTPAASTAAATTSAAASVPATGASLTMWVDAERAPALKSIAAKFKTEKGIDVKLVVKDFAAVRDDFITQAPTGKGPDIMVGPHDWLGKLVQNGVVAPVQLGDKSAQFAESSIKAMTYDGQTYGVPYSIENVALVRNTALVPEAKTTLDDVLAEGKKAVTAGDAKFPFLVGLDPKQADPYHLYPLQTSLGSQVFAQNEDGSYDSSKLLLDSEGGKKFAQLLADLGDKGSKVLNSNITGDIAKEKFLAGESPYFLTGPWNVPDIEAKGIKFAIDPLPTTGDQPAQPFIGVNGFFISAKSTNALAANEFVVNYLTQQQAQDELFKVGGRPPALTASFDTAASDPVVKAFGEIGANGVPMPAVPAMDAVWADWGATELNLIKGKEADPATAWSKMAANIEKKIASSK